jgi:microcystin-dependent protein
MSEPFLGQIEMFGFGFAPRYWATAAGQTMSIPQNQALFSLIGTFYGGDGIRTFNLPDLRGRVPTNQGTDRQGIAWSIGQTGGEEGHLLAIGEIPAHNHTAQVSSNTATSTNTYIPSASVTLSVTTGINGQTPFNVPIYVADNAPASVLHPSAVGQAGGQPHENRMPSLAVNFCICLNGLYPPRG